MGKGFPHLKQNFAEVSFEVPQLGQNIFIIPLAIIIVTPRLTFHAIEWLATCRFIVCIASHSLPEI
jgi:hypothetical protein